MNRADEPPNAFEAGKQGTAARDMVQETIEALRQKGGLFVEAVRATRMPMALTDPRLPGNPIVFANQAFHRLSGYSRDEVLGQQPHFMNGRLTDPQDAARFAEALRGEQDDIIETIQYRKDGSRFVATVLISAFKDDQGETVNHFMSWLDVTRRVEAEAEVAELRQIQSAQKLAEAGMALELDSTKILQDLAARLVSEDNVQTISEEVLSAAIKLTGAKAGTVQILESETEELLILAARGFSQQTLDYFRRVDACAGTSCGEALRTVERAYFNFDPASPDQSARLHVADGILSAQSTPLISLSGRVIGMISTHWGELDHRPSERELRFLDLLARQAADLIEQRRSARLLSDRERRAQTLLAELQHRVRNTLSVIRSIVRRTARSSTTIEEFEQHLDGRLSSFARTQAYVTRDPEGGIDLEMIIRDELLAHAARGAKEIRIEGPEVRLDAKRAETVGLAVHELTSNAVKYGALASDGNRLNVSWSLKGKGANRMLHFCWLEELAHRKLAKPDRAGFGTELLERVLSYELDATPKLSFQAGGFSYEVQIPISAPASSH